MDAAACCVAAQQLPQAPTPYNLLFQKFPKIVVSFLQKPDHSNYRSFSQPQGVVSHHLDSVRISCSEKMDISSPYRDGLPTTAKPDRRWRSKPLTTSSKPSILLAFFSCVAWLYIAGRFVSIISHFFLLIHMLFF